MDNLFIKLGVAGTTSIILTEAVNPAPLWNALITLGVSVVTVLSIEGIAWLRAFIKKHTAKDTDEDNKEVK